MSRDIRASAEFVLRASDTGLVEHATRDPELFRDLAASWIASQDALRPFAMKAKAWEVKRPGMLSHPRLGSQQIEHRLGDFQRARDAYQMEEITESQGGSVANLGA